MKKLFKIFIYSIALLFILTSATLSFLITTNTGLYASLRITNWFIPGKLSVKKATGTLLSHWQLDNFNYQSKELTVKIDTIETDWKLMNIIRGQLNIKKLTAGDVDVQTHKVETVNKQTSPPTNSNDQSLQLPFDIFISELALKHLTIDQQNVSDIKLSIHIDKSKWDFTKLSLKTDQFLIDVTGKIQPTPELPIDLKLSAKAIGSNGYSGELTLKGNWQDYAWQGYVVKPFTLLTSGHIKEGDSIDGQAKWQEFTLPGKHKQLIRIAPGEFLISGTAEKLVFNLKTALVQPVQTKISAFGYHSPLRNEATITIKPNHGKITTKIIQELEQQHRKTSIQFKGNSVNLKPFGIPVNHLNFKGEASGYQFLDFVINMTAKGFYQHNPISLTLHKTAQSITGEVHLANNQISFQGNNPFPLTIKGSIPSPQLFSPGLEGLKTNINLTGQFNSPTDGYANLSIHSGEYIPPEGQSMPPLSFIGGNYKLTLSNRGLQITGKLAIDQQKQLLTRLLLPNFSLQSQKNSAQTISGKLSLKINSLDFLSQINPNISDAKGSINAQLNVSGPLSSPRLNGKIDLMNGSFKTPYSDNPYQPVTAKFITNNNSWQLQGKLSHSNSQLTIQGAGKFNSHLNGNISIIGNQFLVMNNKEYQVYISPNMTIRLSPYQTLITGDISIPKARISPQTFSSTVTLSDDVVFASKQQEETQGSPFQLDLRVTMGDDVNLFIEGLSAKIIGSIRLQKLSGGVLSSSGQLSVSNGKYAAYGQQLDISQGELLFTGGAITNPGINLRASRTFNTAGQAFSGSNRLFDFGASNIQSMSFSNTTTVGIQVSGRINNPKVSLFSEPSNLQQSDILAMLLLGRPASQASDAGGQLLLSAITSMGLDKGAEGGQMLSQLKNKLGLDFDVNTNTTYDREQDTVSSTHSIGVKKKFSDRLSVGYNMGIYDSSAMVLTLTYLLNKYLSIQVNASDKASGIDLTYTRSKD